MCAINKQTALCSKSKSQVMFVRTRECLKTFEEFRKGQGKIVFGHMCFERVKQTNNAAKVPSLYR